MKINFNACLYIICILTAILIFNCAKTENYDLSIKNTVSIFLLNKEKNYYFCIPVQYLGDYKIDNFEFDSGYVQIGDYKILLNRDEINIYVYLNESIDDIDFPGGEFDLVYSQENGKVSISKMNEPLTIKQDNDERWNYYYIFIERYLKDDEMKKIFYEYKKGNVYSQVFIGYDITIDNEPQSGSGMYDDFELSDEPAVDYTLFFPNMEFFRKKYL